MKTTSRDKWLMAVIPALVTGIGYIFFTGSSAVRALNDVRSQLERAREGPRGDLTVNRQTLSAINERLSREKQRSATLKSTSLKLPGIEPTAAARTNVLRVLSDLLASKDLILLKSTKLEGASSNVLPVQIETLAKRLSDQAALPHAEFWQLEIDGSYPNMLDALRAITRSGSFVVPVSIGMEPGPSQNGELRWFLTVWI